MLSTHSFNALLKTLEEPPPHVKFLLATTDPQKLPATILSRCLQFNLKNMTPERIVGHLQYVLEQEMVTFDESALWLLGRAADGSMRDALSLTDQAVAFGSGKLSEPDVRNMLGTIDQTAVYEVLDALVAHSGTELLAAVAKLSEHAPDFSAALEELLSLLHRVAIAQAVPDAVDNSFGDSQRVIDLAAKIPAEDVQLFYQLGLAGRRDLPLAPDLRGGFEMLLLRMLAFRPTGVITLPQTPLASAASGTAQNRGAEVPAANVKKSEASAPVRSALSATEGAKGSASPQANASLPSPLSDADRSVSVPPAQASAPPQANTPTQAPALEKTPLTAPMSQPSPVRPVVEGSESSISLCLDDLTPDNWAASVENFGFGGVLGNIISHCVLVQKNGAQLSLVLDQANATLFNDGHTPRIERQLSDVLGAELNVIISTGQPTLETPAQRVTRISGERKDQAIHTLENDPNVQLLVEHFGASLNIESVTPIH